MAKRKLGRPKSPDRTIQVGVILFEDIAADVTERAKKEGLTRAGWIRRAVYRQIATEDAAQS